MGTIHVGVRHDDYAAVAQLGTIKTVADAADERLDQVFQFLLLAPFTFFPRTGSPSWVSRLRACFAEPPAESPSTRKISVSAAFSRVQSVSLPGSRNRLVGDFRAVSLLSLRRIRSSARSITKASRLSAEAGSPARK